MKKVSTGLLSVILILLLMSFRSESGLAEYRATDEPVLTSQLFPFLTHAPLDPLVLPVEWENHLIPTEFQRNRLPVLFLSLCREPKAIPESILPGSPSRTYADRVPSKEVLLLSMILRI